MPQNLHFFLFYLDSFDALIRDIDLIQAKHIVIEGRAVKCTVVVAGLTVAATLQY